MKITCHKRHFALAFSFLFITLGWMVPMSYSAYAPQDNFIEVHDFEAENLSANETVHKMYFDRTIHQQTTGTVYTELWLVDHENDKRTRISSDQTERPLKEGRRTVVTEQTIPPEAQGCTYTYEMTITMELREGRIERTFSFESEEFKVER